LYNILSRWRADQANDEEVRHYQVLSTKSLLEIAEVRPTSSDNLDRIHGLGKVRIAKYGAAIIHIYVATGEIEVTRFLDQKKLDTLVAYFEKAESHSFTEAFQKLGGGYSYGDLRMALSHMKREDQDK